PSLLPDSLPRAFHMTGLSVGLADAESKRELSVELSVSEVQVAAAIQPVHQELIGLILISLILISMISRAQPEADKIELGRRSEFEARIVAHPGCELLSQAYVLANVVLQAFDPVMPDHKPQLERAKTAPELDVPVAIINDGAGFRRLVAQVLRQHGERLDQVLAVGDVEDVAIEVGEHPFVRVEGVAVRELHAIVDEAE